MLSEIRVLPHTVTFLYSRNQLTKEFKTNYPNTNLSMRCDCYFKKLLSLYRKLITLRSRLNLCPSCELAVRSDKEARRQPCALSQPLPILAKTSVLQSRNAPASDDLIYKCNYN